MVNINKFDVDQYVLYDNSLPFKQPFVQQVGMDGEYTHVSIWPEILDEEYYCE